MLNNIQSALERLGLSTQKRAIHVQFSNAALNTQLFLQRIDGEHALNKGLTAELICLSIDATIPLKQFIGSQVAVDTVTDRGTLVRTTGIISHAAVGESDGSLTLYKLKLEDSTVLWKYRRNSRVFMAKSAIDVIESIFREWQQRSALFAASLSLDLSGLQKDYDVRPFIMQSAETDYDFLTRLMRQEGICWLVDEAQLTVSNSSDPIQPQKLRLVDDNSQYQALDRRHIRFHRSSATEQQDSMTGFVGQRSLQPTVVHVQRWQADALEQEDGAGSVLSKHKHSDNYDNASLGLENSWHFSPAWMQDLNGEDGATASGNSQIEKLNQNLSNYYDAQAKQFVANSTVRDAHVGYWFELNEHPEIDQHSGADKEFLITSKTFYNQNNLPKDLQLQVQNLLDQSQWQIKPVQKIEERQANTLSLQRRNIAVVPEFNPLQHRPAAHPQRAKVVGPSGETIHVDAWGRIKVRFMFTRPDDHEHDGGAGSNDNDTDSAWVDVLTPWAGEGYGARFLPRIGEIVVIDFFDGNIDRPFVLGRIHEAYRVPTQFDSKGQLPDTKKLSGIRSQEVGGDGFGQLRFDDTTEQISTQLQSSHGATQLNLGNLSHPKDSDTSEGRGEGFELRTDQWGAVRAGQGMLITTYAQHNALAEHLEATQEQALLVQGQENMKMLSEIAVKQQTDALNVVNRLPKFIQSLQLNTKNQALNATLNLFKQGLASDPLNVLKDCGGFIQDIGTFGGGVQDIVDSFNRYFSNAPEAMNNLQSFMENIGNSSSQSIKDKVLAFKDQISNDPFLALQNVGSLISSVDLSALNVSNGSSGTSNIAPMDTLSSLQNFMEDQTQNLEASDDLEKQEQGKIFRQALMLLASPNGIALTTPEDIFLNAIQDIAQAAQGSINLSAQKNIITHALDKISLFAAQKGIDIFAGKGEIKIQAQDDAIEAIARKVIQIISTEDKIELTSAKEIDMKAGGSQLIINSRGVFIKTNGLFESKAGQHSFVNGIKVPYEVPQLPNTPIFSNRLDVYDVFWQSDFSKLSYKAFIPDNNSFLSGQIDEHGRTGKINTADPSKVKLLVGEDGEWGVSIEAYDISEFDEESITMQADNQLNNDEFNG